VRFGWRKKNLTVGGPPVSEVREREGVTVRVCVEVGRGPILKLGQMGSPGPFYIFFFLFFFSYFLFSISFIDFAKLLQINSNHFQKFCKIHRKVFKPISNMFSK
jgi:hypothetical protein